MNGCERKSQNFYNVSFTYDKMGHCISTLKHCDEGQYFSAINELYLML